MRRPMLGESVPLETGFVMALIALGAALLGSRLIGRYRHRVIFWA